MVADEATTDGVSRFAMLFREHAPLIAFLLLCQLVVYSYFFTTLIFTNHTFPHSWVSSYPSFTTTQEGRWFADILFWLQGGTGVQPFQMAVAVVLQSINGILFAHILGLKKRLEIVLAALFICLYPAFLDDYSFAIVHVVLVLGDSLALAGVLYGMSRPLSVGNATVVALMFVLSLACYPPKIALLLVLSLCWVVIDIVSGVDRDHDPRGNTARLVAYVSAIVVAACAVYFASAKLSVSQDSSYFRVDVNTMSEAVRQMFAAYRSAAREYLSRADYLPPTLRALPVLAIALGSIALLVNASQQNVAAFSAVAILITMMPLALRASYIINSATWEGVGRITFVYGYALLFFIAFGLRAAALRRLRVGLLAIFVYCFVIDGTQETNAAALKTLYDVNIINRIAARVEAAVSDSPGRRHALVVIGEYPEFNRLRYVRYAVRQVPLPRVHTQTSAFIAYRQPEILNFFLGQDILEAPSPEQSEKALTSAHNRRPWPAADAVYVLEDIIVVVLEKYRPNIVSTWTTVDRLHGKPSPAKNSIR